MKRSKKGTGGIRAKSRPVLTRLRESNSVKTVVFGYLGYMLIGTLLLSVPLLQSERVSFIDNIFVSASAVSTTGLTPVNISRCYNTAGHMVILLLIQLGGIGYMTFSSFVLLSSKDELTDKRKQVSKTVFSIPKDFLIERFLAGVVVFTLLIEALGTAGLYFAFRAEGVRYPLWQALFTSVSAFCTAGLSLFSNNLEAFSGNFWINTIVCALSLSGAIGFIVFVDVFNTIRRKQRTLSLTSRIILRTTFWVLAIGTFLVLISEGSFKGMPVSDKVMAAFFHTMSSMTTVGFNTVPVAGLARSVLFLTVILMLIGASPAGTGGGIKTTTLTAVLGQIRSVIFNRRDVRYWRQLIPAERVKQANATLGLYLSALFLGVYLLTLTEKGGTDLMDILFEAASALGTVGLSHGLLAEMSVMGKLVLIFLMFIGRVGPLTFGIAVFVKDKLIWDDTKTDLAV